MKELWRCLALGAALHLLVAVPLAAETFVVVPFENTARQTDLDWVGESFAEAVTRDLEGNGHTLVGREERLAVLDRLGLPPFSPLSRATLLRLGEEVGADYVVLGRYEVAGAQLTAHAQVLDLRQLALSPPLQEAASFERLLDIQARLAWRVLRHLDPRFPYSFDAFQQRLPRVSVSAFENYIRGLLAMDRDQQVRYFLQAARLEASFSAPTFRLAQLYYEAEDYSTAARWFDRIPGEDGLALDARFYLALCYFHLQDLSRATLTLTPLATRLPVKPVWTNLGVFASHLGDATALAYFNRAVQQDSGDPDLYFNLGLHHLRNLQWDEAARALQRALELNPGDTEALFLRGHALMQLGRKEEAERLRQQAVGDNPALALSLERRGLELDRLDEEFSSRARPGPARRENLEAAAARAQHVALHLQRGEDLMARDQLEEAIREFTEAILIDPDSCRAHLRLGETYQRQARLPEAVTELKAALWCQESIPARLRLAEIYLNQNQVAQAREQVRAVLTLDPANAVARTLEARLAASPAEAAKPK